MDELQSGISALVEATEKSSDANTAVAGDEVVSNTMKVIELSDVLSEWYRRAGPSEFEIPWSADWLTLYSVDELLECQVGYRWENEVNGKRFPEWKDSWLVIGDCSSDPIIAALDSENTPIYLARHGQGAWEPKLVAPSLGSFLSVVAKWMDATSSFGDLHDDEGVLKPEFVSEIDAGFRNLLPDDCAQTLLEFAVS